MDFRSCPKKWNDASLGELVALPEYPQARPWPLLGMLAIGLLAGAAIGGYAVSQRAQMKRLVKQAHRMGDELAVVAEVELTEPVVVTQRSNHRRKARSEV